MKVERLIEERLSRHAGETKQFPIGFNLCEKTIAEERGILMPLLMNGSAEMCTTT
jgi:hypothetical protein